MRAGRRIAGIWAFGVLAGLMSPALASPDFPRGSEARERVLLGTAGDDLQSWRREEARSAVSAGMISEGHARAVAIRAQKDFGADVDVVSFLLLMQATRDANADLQAVMDRSREAWDDQAERSSMAHNKPPVTSTLDPGTQAVLSLKPKTVPLVSTNKQAGAQLRASPIVPVADTDDSIHVDLQTAMDRETEAEDAVAAALHHLPAGATAVVPAAQP